MSKMFVCVLFVSLVIFRLCYKCTTDCVVEKVKEKKSHSHSLAFGANASLYIHLISNYLSFISPVGHFISSEIQYRVKF